MLCRVRLLFVEFDVKYVETFLSAIKFYFKNSQAPLRQ